MMDTWYISPRAARLRGRKTGVTRRFSPTSFLFGVDQQRESAFTPRPDRIPGEMHVREPAAGLWRFEALNAAGHPLLLLGTAIAIGLSGPLPAEDRPTPAAASRVEVTLDVQGQLFAEASPEQSPLTQAIQLDARFEFTESAVRGDATVVRRYHTAVADYTAGGQTTRSILAVDAREVLVALRGTTPSSYLSEGFLSRDESDLLEMPFDSSLVDGMRSATPIATAAGWSVPADLTAGLLAIDTVESGSLEATLTGVADGTATVALSGTVTGGVDGAPTRITVTGAFRCGATLADDDAGWLLDGRIETLDVEIAERREAGWVAPGLDVTAELKLVRSPSAALSEPDVTSRQLGQVLADRPRGPGRPGTVWERHRQGRYTLVLDERWRVVEDGSEGIVMRLMDRGALVAQCSIMPLPRTAPDAPPAVDTVRRDVERSLGDQFGLVVAAEQTTRGDGTRVVRVVAEGTAEDRPFRWIHQVLTDPAGHRAAVTCMHEPAAADRFAIADRELVAGLVLAADSIDPPPREARLPQATAPLETEGKPRISPQAP